MLSGSTYPTSNLFFNQARQIFLKLQQGTHDLDTFICTMTKPMMAKFLKYWNESHMLFAFAIVLDPRFKMEIISFSFKIMFHEDQEKASALTAKIRQGYAILSIYYIIFYAKLTYSMSSLAYSLCTLVCTMSVSLCQGPPPTLCFP
jgi:hypothetical protein